MSKDIEKLNKEILVRLAKDPVFFCQKVLNFKPYWYQKMILQSKSRKIALCTGRQIGKTTALAKKVLHFAYTRANSLVLIISPSQRQSIEFLRRIKNDINSSELLRASIVRETQTELEIRNGSRIISVPASTDTIRGYSPDLVCIDEAAHFVSDEVYYEAVRPMLMHTKGSLILISTPKGKRGFFYEAFDKSKNPDFETHILPAIVTPEVVEKYKDWGLTKKDIGKPICPDISLQDLEAEKKAMDSLTFMQEYMAKFLDESLSFFPYELISSCVDKRLGDSEYGLPNKKYFVGVDWGRKNDSTVITVVERDEDNIVKVVHIKEFSKISYEVVLDYIINLFRRFPILKLFSDTGSGLSQIDRLKREGLPVFGIDMSLKRKADMFTYLRMKMERGELKIPHNLKLIDQLHQFRQEITELGNVRFKHPEGRGYHDDYVDSLALAVYATKTGYVKPFVRKVKKLFG